MMNRTPLRDALTAAGIQDLEGRMTYQDYLNIVVNMYKSQCPITEEQWETMCDMLGADRPIYASNIKQIIDILKERP